MKTYADSESKNVAQGEFSSHQYSDGLGEGAFSGTDSPGSTHRMHMAALNRRPQVAKTLQFKQVLNHSPQKTTQTTLVTALQRRRDSFGGVAQTNPKPPIEPLQPELPLMEFRMEQTMPARATTGDSGKSGIVQMSRGKKGGYQGKQGIKSAKAGRKVQNFQQQARRKHETQPLRPPKGTAPQPFPQLGTLGTLLMVMMILGSLPTVQAQQPQPRIRGPVPDRMPEGSGLGGFSNSTLVNYSNSTTGMVFTPPGQVGGPFFPQFGHQAVGWYDAPRLYQDWPSLLPESSSGFDFDFEELPTPFPTGRGFNLERSTNTSLALGNTTKGLPHADRLSPEIQKFLVSGVGMARNPSATGQKGLLNQRQVVRAGETLGSLSPEKYQTFKNALKRAGRGKNLTLTPEDRAVQKLLLYKSLGARKDVLLGGNSTAAESAMQEILEFARGIRRSGKTELLELSSLTDLNSDVSTSLLDPTSLDTGVTGVDTQTDNDGYYQHHVTTCGPSSLMLALADEDPIFARQIKQDCTDTISSDPVAEQQEKRIWSRINNLGESSGTHSLKPRLADGYYKRISDWVGTHAKDDSGQDELMDFLENPATPTLGLKGSTLLDLIQQNNNGFPTTEDLAVIRTYPVKSNGLGIGGAVNLKGGLERILTPFSGTKYRIAHPPDDGPYAHVKPGKQRDMLIKKGLIHTLDPVIEALKQGETIMCSIVKPDHQMSMSDIRGIPGAYEFLVHDTWTGKTVWVTEKALLDGTFVRDNLQYDTYSKDTRLSEFHVPEPL